MKVIKLCLVIFYILSCRVFSDTNTFKHPSFGLSISKPATWEFLNPNHIQARISSTKLKDDNLEMLIKAFIEPPMLEIAKENNQQMPPKLSITVNPIERYDDRSPIAIIKNVAKHAPDAFKNYTVVGHPNEIEIAGKNGAYMKAEYTGQFISDANEYPLVYETWIIPMDRYFFMIGAVSQQDSSNEVRKEIAGMINSLKIENDDTSFQDRMYSIMFSHFDEADQNNYSFNDCLQIAKPYGMWDIRPRGISMLDIGGELARTRDVSWFYAGTLSAHFNLSQEKLPRLHGEWIENVGENNLKLKSINTESKSKLISLVEMTKQSEQKIFISSDKFNRVDNVFCQNKKYWKYDIPENSYFSISDEKIFLNEGSYHETERAILEQLKELGYYGIVKHNNTIIVIIDGFLSSSYGYIFAPSEWDLISLGPLYNIQDLQMVNSNPDCYFYFSR